MSIGSIGATTAGGFHGIDIGRAEALAATLARWVSDVSEIQGDVALGESLAELPSDLHGEFEELSRTGSELAHAISAASRGLTAHQLKLSNQFKQLQGLAVGVPRIRPRTAQRHPFDPGNPIEQAHDIAHAQNLVDRRRHALATGQPLNPDDERQLEALFGKYIADHRTASTAYALASDGAIPIAHAFRYESVDDIEADFSRVLLGMARGVDPADGAIPVGLYPAAYRDWITSDPPTSALTNRFGTRANLKPSVPLPGLLDQQFRLPHMNAGRRTLDDWQIASAVAMHLGPVSYSWLGRTIAPGAAGEWGIDATAAAGEMAAMDGTTAVAMFNALGTDGIAKLVYDIGVDPFTAQHVLPSFARALAQASGHPDLGFTGFELLQADGRGDELGFDFRQHESQFVEQLLDADGYDHEFLVQATIGSFAVRHSHGTRWPASPITQIDPRNIALASIAANNASRSLLDQLGTDQLATMLAKHNPANPWRGAAVEHDWAGQLSPIELVLAQLGTDPDAMRIITDAVGADPAQWTFIDDNALIANGLSIALALTSPSYVPAADGQHGFIETYDHVLRGGSGGHMVLVESQLRRHEVARQLRTATNAGTTPALDLTGVANFLGKVSGTRAAVYNDHPELAGLASDRLMRTQDGLATAFSVGGLFPTPASVPLGLLSLSVGALPIDGTTALEGHLLNSQQHETQRPMRISLDVIDETLAASSLGDNALPHHLQRDTRMREQIRHALTTNDTNEIAKAHIPLGDSIIAVPSLLIAANAANAAQGIAHSQTFANRTNVQRTRPTVPGRNTDTQSLRAEWGNDN